MRVALAFIASITLTFSAGCGDRVTSSGADAGLDGRVDDGGGSSEHAFVDVGIGLDLRRHDLTADQNSQDLGPKTGSWPAACGAALTKTAVPCGGGISTCVVARDEVAMADRNVGYGPRPHFALDSAGVAFVADTRDGSPLAVRGATGWQQAKLGLHVFDLTGAPGALLAVAKPTAPPTNSGAWIWQRGSGGSWTVLDKLSLDMFISARDTAGCLHTALFDRPGKRVIYGQRDSKGGWRYADIEPADKYTTNALDIAVALEPSGAAHFAYWRTSYSSKGWQLAWTSAKGRVVRGLGSNVLVERHIAFAVSGPSSPHIFFVRRGANGFNHELAYASGPNLASVAVVRRDEGTLCGTPSYDGETCALDWTHSSVQDVVVSGGAVRLIYARRRQTAALVAKCTGYPSTPGGGLPGGGFRKFADAGPPRPSCAWTGAKKTTAWLEIAWPVGGGGVATSGPLLQGKYPAQGSRARARVDAAGNIHLALYDYDNTTVNRADVRYIMLSAKP